MGMSEHTNPRSPVESLNQDEADHVRRVVAEHGMAKAIDLLGLRTRDPVLKALAGLPVARLTAMVIRAKLAAL